MVHRTLAPEREWFVHLQFLARQTICNLYPDVVLARAEPFDTQNLDHYASLRRLILDRLSIAVIFYLPPTVQYWGGVPYSFAPGYRGTDRFDAAGQGNSVFNWDVSGYPGNFQPGTTDPNFVTWGMVAIDENSLQSAYSHQYNACLQYSFKRGQT